MTAYEQARLDTVASTHEQDPLGDITRTDDCSHCADTGQFDGRPCFICVDFDALTTETIA